jgi:hypothetical protein
MAMKTAGLILTLLVTVSASAQTNQSWPACRYPIRAFAGHATVNLTPLFQWWSHQPLSVKPATNQDNIADAERPLAAWQRVTGTKAGEAGSNWVVNAVIFTSPTIRTNARIILNHPPATEEQTFYALKTKLVEVGRQITNAQRSYQANTNAAQKNEGHARAWIRSGSKVANQNANNLTRLASQKREAANAAFNQEKQLETSRAQMQKQLDAIPAINGQYHIDWFAVAVGQTKAGVPIYDLGAVNFSSP